MLPLVYLLVAVVYTFTPTVSAIERSCACPNITAHPNPTKWMKDEMAKPVNMLMMSRANYIIMAEILTGGTKLDIAEHACFKASCQKPDEKSVHLTLQGYKSVADYECIFAEPKLGCSPTKKSTNEEWAKKLPLGRPTTIFSDDKSYTVEVRCPRNHERVWYVLSTKDSLHIDEQFAILSILKAHGFDVAGHLTFCNKSCEK